MTPEEYLEYDRRSEFKNEYVFGEIVSMAGGSPRHSAVNTNIIAALARRLGTAPCRVYDSGLRVCLQKESFYSYPDATVICGPMAFTDAERDTATNPKVIFEVLSPSTRNYDLGDKARMYQGISTLDEIVFVEQGRPRIELWRRMANGHWDMSYIEGIQTSLILEIHLLRCAPDRTLRRYRLGRYRGYGCPRSVVTAR